MPYLIVFFLLQNFSAMDSTLQNNKVFFYDSFENLNNWESFQFSSGKKPTEYKIITENDNHCLQIKSDLSASGLICKTKFNPNEYPLLKWKWKVNNIIPSTSGNTKEGDDYPLRIFVMFEKDSSQISFWKKLEKSAIRLISGYEPPYKSLCYVWANTKSDTSAYFSPYTDDVMIICKQSGSDSCNQWIENQVNIVEDYKKYFDKKVPSIACIAIMGDTDNTESQTLSYIDFLEIESAN
jgi:DUF3047 family protein